MGTIEEKYVTGFNHAYILKQHKPKLIESILNTTSDNDYIQGLKDGERCVELDKRRSRFQELNDLNTDKSLDQELER